jgi:glycosyltransferase involved in cell wall biosynthesis
MNDPLLSVLLPCCNGGATLGPALQSVLSQTFRDFELIFLNDGSTDNSVEIAESYNDTRIRIVGGPGRCGLPVRLNQGVAQARGQFIARMDADDISFPERFEKQLAFLQAHPEVDLLGCRAVAFRDNGETIGLLPFAPTHERLCAQPWRNIPLPHPSWMGRRSWFQLHSYRLPEVRRAEDQELLLRSCKDSRYACLGDVLLGYRQGQFQFKRTLVARRAMLSAQLGLFYMRREWHYAVLALASATVKTAVDCLCALPGLKKLFFTRMGEPASESVQHQLAKCLTQYGVPRHV